MPADRKIPAPSNTPGGGISGTAFMEDALTEVQALWRYAKVPLSSVVGSNTITAQCDVPLDVRGKGNKFTFTPVAPNTVAPTLEINGKGQLPLRDRSGAVLPAGRLATGRAEDVEDFGTEYRLMIDPPPSAAVQQRSLFAYQLNNGVAAGGLPTGWMKYPINTLILNEIGITFNAGLNRLTLPARTYEVDASAWAYSYAAGLFLVNTSDGGAAMGGMARSTMYAYGQARTTGKFTLATPKDVELWLYSSNAGGSLGNPLTSGHPEQYGFIDFRSTP